jgi:periplasmic divalent cation tolerance protein
MSYNIVIMTANNYNEAEKIVKILLEERLIACANIISSVSSFFWWEGKITKENEVLVIIKSKETLFNKLAKRINTLHSYEIPEILALPIIAGSKSYLKWMESCFKLEEYNG